MIRERREKKDEKYMEGEWRERQVAYMVCDENIC